jgi:hypothetical protein
MVFPPQQRPTREGGGTQPYKPPVGKSTIQGSPGLLTSTGGLFGSSYFLLMPLFDSVFDKTYLAFIDPSNFDTEEDCFYTFRQEDVMPGRKVSVHMLIVTYREIGKCTFTIGVQSYIAETDSFKVSSRQVVITPRLNSKNTFPNNKLKTRRVNIDVIAGERPQVFVSRKANSGPLSITRVMMAGHADEKDFL